METGNAKCPRAKSQRTRNGCCINMYGWILRSAVFTSLVDSNGCVLLLLLLFAIAALNPQHVTMETQLLSSNYLALSVFCFFPHFHFSLHSICFFFRFCSSFDCCSTPFLCVGTMNVQTISNWWSPFIQTYVLMMPNSCDFQMTHSYNVNILLDFVYSICRMLESNSELFEMETKCIRMQNKTTTTNNSNNNHHTTKNCSQYIGFGYVCQLMNIHLVVHYGYYCAHLKCTIYWSSKCRVVIITKSLFISRDCYAVHFWFFFVKSIQLKWKWEKKNVAAFDSMYFSISRMFFCVFVLNIKTSTENDLSKWWNSTVRTSTVVLT